MKLPKRIFLALALFSQSFLYAQILEPGDIDIFVRGFNELENVFNAGPEAESEAGDYLGELETVSGLFLRHISGTEKIGKNDYAFLKTEYQRILELVPPREFEEAFTAIGWNKDGHKKCMTILFIGSALMNSHEDFPPKKKILRLFNRNDVSITGGRISDLEDL